jgi:hypothetical protein
VLAANDDSAEDVITIGIFIAPFHGGTESNLMLTMVASDFE